MKFIDFLNEAIGNTKFIKSISDDEIINLIKTKCKNANLKNPLLRGMHDVGDYLEMNGKDVNRTALHGNNLHTICFNHNFEGTKFAPRSKSIICASGNSTSFVKTYGTPYVVIPFDDVDLSVCMDSVDIFFASNTVLNTDVVQISNLLTDNLLRTYAKKTYNSIDDIKKDILKIDLDKIGTEYHRNSKFKSIVDFIGIENIKTKNVDAIMEKILELYDPKNYEFKVIKNSDTKLKGKCEVWFSGMCVAIKKTKWNEILNQLEKEKES